MTTAQWLRAACQRIGRGSGYLCWALGHRTAATARRWAGGIRGWLSEASGWEWCLRVGILLVLGLVARKLGGGLLGTIAAHSDRLAWLLWPITIGWCITAYRTHNRPRVVTTRPTETAAEGAEPEGEEGETPPPTPAPASAPPTLPELLDAAEKIGTPHVHIAVLAETLGTTPAAVRDRLTRSRIPIGDVRMRGRGSSTGVRHEDLAPYYPTPSAPSDGVVGAGQEANNNDNNTSGIRVTRNAGGAQITVHDGSKHHTTRKGGREVNDA
ncbi:hypothetical protein OG897_06240 [Streptomyces sp. NBC_00237]|uniref:hypothetical protein n=1 Tax=Streptomyces sp. NBC_00237 TaxID=2975687 RepID=UPI00225A301B|nr:hypothetical protein [Streptomyces sp. NBC_00237]MCX5201061.1 hypothetical protein [Streptomyces sp. NBC_00237]